MLLHTIMQCACRPKLKTVDLFGSAIHLQLCGEMWRCARRQFAAEQMHECREWSLIMSTAKSRAERMSDADADTFVVR